MAELIPPGLSPATALFLVAVSFLTSALTAAVGIGGGVLLLAVMASVLAPTVLIPVHGIVQLGSNAGRALVLRRHACAVMLAPFAAGALAGAAVGAAVVTDLPEAWLRLAIGAFVIWSALGRLPAIGEGSTRVLAAGGFASTLLTMFVGATGPFVLALVRQAGLPRQALVATTAVAMTLQHGLKVAAFSLAGFAFAAWLPLMAAMIATGFLGTLAGTRILGALPEATFRRALTVLLVVLGAQLVGRAVLQLAG